MGQTAENVAEFKGVSRQRQDEFACLSQNRAEAARDRGFFEREITPYPLDGGRLLQNDDGIRCGYDDGAPGETSCRPSGPTAR